MRSTVGLLAAALLFRTLSYAATADVEDKRMNLDECISVALIQHPNVAASRGRVVEAQGRFDAAKGLRLPQVDFRTEAQRYDWLPPNKAKTLGGGLTDVYSAVTLSQLLFSSGKAEANIDSASANLLASKEDRRRVRQEVVFAVARSYYNLLKAQAILEARTEAVRQMEQHLKVAEEKLAVGKAAKLDVLRAEVQLADVTQAQVAAANQVGIAKLQLLNAIGIGSPGQDIAITDDRSPAESVAEAGPLLDQTFKTHPDYLKSKLLLRAAESSLRAARADTGPNLSLVASYNREGKDIPEITNWNAGLVLTVPIFTGGITQAKVDQAKGVLQQNASNSDLVEQNIALAVRSAVLATQDAAERLKTTQKSLEQAREALAVAQEKYAAGLGSTTEVIDTQVALTQAETNYANALYDGKIAAAQLEYAIGKDPAVSEIPGGQNP